MNGTVIPASECTERDLCAMYALMAEFYDDTDEAVFRKDFAAKDHCLLLRDDDRGQSFISFLTPSQLISILLIAGSVVLFIVLKRAYAWADAKEKTDKPASGSAAEKESE